MSTKDDAMDLAEEAYPLDEELDMTGRTTRVILQEGYVRGFMAALSRDVTEAEVEAALIAYEEARAALAERGDAMHAALSSIRSV